MARGTFKDVNQALGRPLTIGGVERRLVLINAVFSLPLVMVTQFRFPASVVGVVLFLALHVIGTFITKRDPFLTTVFRRSTRYSVRPYFPARSHPLMTEVWPIKTVSRPLF